MWSLTIRIESKANKHDLSFWMECKATPKHGARRTDCTLSEYCRFQRNNPPKSRIVNQGESYGNY